MTTATDTCWADPLSRAERRVLREKMARACWASHAASAHGCSAVCTEMQDLHLDVTERAEVPAS